jgi:uncharacterized protein
MDLEVNVAQLLKEQVGSTRVVEFDGPVLELEDQAALASVRATLRLVRTDRGVWATGDASISVDEDCSRCLVPFTFWLTVKVDEVYLPVVEVSTGARLQYDTLVDADTLKIDEHHVIDFTEAFRQYRLAAMPLAPLCRPECKGICSQCGADLNENDCGCTQDLDPRWAKLRELLN